MSSKTLDFRNGYTVRIEQDPDPINPRIDYDNHTTMLCWHKRYSLGDPNNTIRRSSFNSWAELERHVEKEFKPIAMLPLYMYDHSGLTISTKPFGCPWDSGQIGFILITAAQLKQCTGHKVVTKKDREQATKILLVDVEVYDQYLTGEVYGYEVVQDDTDEVVDSCWGYFGDDAVKRDALAALQRYADAVPQMAKCRGGKLQ